MTLSRDLVRVMLKKRADIPREIRDKARLHALDNIGIAIAAACKSPLGSDVLSAFEIGTGGGRCGVIGRRRKLPPTSAAFVNSSFAHIMDYDDIHDLARIHPSSVTLPAAIAAAEIADARGDAILDALAIGNELICRLGKAVLPTGTGPGSEWFLSQLFGYMAGALSAGIAMKLTEDQLVSALGLAYMQLAGGKEVAFGIGANSRAIYTGFAAQGGLQAALLARSGLIGPATAVEGESGMFPLYLGMKLNDVHLSALLDPDHWEWAETAIKPWPCCRSSHPYVAVALRLHEKLDIENIARVTVAVNARANRLCQPLEGRRRPETLADAKYSIPYMVAFALAKGRVELTNLHEGSIGDADVEKIAARVDVMETLADVPGPAPAEIEVEMRDGLRLFDRQTEAVRLPIDQLKGKFLDCVKYAGVSDADALWDRLYTIDQLSADDVMACAMLSQSSGKASVGLAG